MQTQAPQKSTASLKTPRRGPINRVSVLVCTRDRPGQLHQCLSSLADQELPDGLICNVCVADNNLPAMANEITDTAVDTGLTITYAHEPEPGYSSVRNTAIAMAVDQNADLIVFLDDDSTAAPDLIAQHIKAFERYDADVIAGAIDGIHFRVREGERLKKSGTGNVALRRWVFDDENGIGLRFDPRLNLLGFEDFEFFRELTCAGGVIIRSGLPRAHDATEFAQCGANPITHESQDTARKIFAVMMGRNEIVATRIRHGNFRAVSLLVTRYTPILFRGIGLSINGLITHPLNTHNATRKLTAGRDYIARALAAVGGLWRPGYNRPLAKTGQLIPIPEISPTKPD